MKKINYILLFIMLVSSQVILSQDKIAKDSWLLSVSPDENFILYFKASTSDPDEYIEGNIYIYDINKETQIELNQDIYIYDFIDVKWLKDGSILFSSGSKITKFSVPLGKESSTIYEVKDKQWINSFSLSKDNNCLLISIEDSSAIKTQKIVFFNLKDFTLTEIYTEEYSEYVNEGKEKFNAILSDNNDFAYILSVNRELIKYNFSEKERQILDDRIIDLYQTSGSNVYYSKKGKIIDYNSLTGDKIEIIEADILKISYFNIYKDKLLICLNDNIFIYDKSKQIFKNIEQLGKRNFVFFGTKIAIEQNQDDNSIILYKNT